MRIPDEVLKCVAFLGVAKLEGTQKKLELKGTGFFVAIVSNPTRAFIYFVTAKHVALKLEGRECYVRMNAKNGSPGLINFTEAKWHYHETADIAILPWAPSLEDVEYKNIPLKMFYDEENLSPGTVGVGDEVFIAGLFSRHGGRSKNIPIVRTGNVAMMPNEPIPTKDFGDMDAYLIEARSIGGVSGSPVFVTVGNDLTGRKMYLLGLIHGHWDVPEDKINDTFTEDTQTKASVNIGIAIVVPARKILKVLNGEKLTALRNSEDKH